MELIGSTSSIGTGSRNPRGPEQPAQRHQPLRLIVDQLGLLLNTS